MFKLADPKQTYRYPVTINVPVGEGKIEPSEFTAEFKLLPADGNPRPSQSLITSQSQFAICLMSSRNSPPLNTCPGKSTAKTL